MATTSSISTHPSGSTSSLVRIPSLRRRHSFSLRPIITRRRRWKGPPQVQHDEGVFLDDDHDDHEPQKKTKQEQVVLEEALPVPLHSWMAVVHTITSHIQIAELWPDSGILVISQLQMPVQTPSLQQWNGLIVPGLQVLAINEEPVSNRSLRLVQDQLQDPQMYPLRLRLSGCHVVASSSSLPGFPLPGRRRRRRRGTALDDLTLGYITTKTTSDVPLVEIQHVMAGGRYDTTTTAAAAAAAGRKNHHPSSKSRSLQAGMVMTNANGKVLVVGGITMTTTSTNKEQQEDLLVSSLSKRLQPKAFRSARPYCVALDISPPHQARLMAEVQHIPVLPLPPSLHAKLYQSLLVLQASSSSSSSSSSQPLPPRRALSLPLHTVHTDVLGKNNKEQPQPQQPSEEIQRFKELYQSSFSYNPSGIPSPFAKASSDSSCLWLEEERQNQEQNEDSSFHTQGTSSMSSFWSHGEEDCLLSSPSSSFSSMGRLSRRRSPLMKKKKKTTGPPTTNGGSVSSTSTSPGSLQRKASIHAQRRLSFQDSSAVLSITVLEEPEEEEEEENEKDEELSSSSKKTMDDNDEDEEDGKKKTFPQISLLPGVTTTPLDCQEEEEETTKESSVVTTMTTTTHKCFDKGDSRLGGLDLHFDLDDDDDSSSSSSSLSHTLFEDKDCEEEEDVSAGESSHEEEEGEDHLLHKLTSTEKTVEDDDDEEEEDDEEEDLETSLSPRQAPIRLLTDTIRAQNYVQRRFAQVDPEQNNNDDNDAVVTTPAAPVLQRRPSFRVSNDGQIAATTGGSSSTTSTTTQESNQTTTASSSLSADWSYRDEPAAAPHDGLGLVVVHSQEFLEEDAQNQQVDRIRILFEKTSVTHRLGLILQQDGNAPPIVIRRILPRGVFGSSSLKSSSSSPLNHQLLQEGDVLLEIQGETPRTPVEAFESLVRCTGSMCSMLIERKRYL